MSYHTKKNIFSEAYQTAEHRRVGGLDLQDRHTHHQGGEKEQPPANGRRRHLRLPQTGCHRRLR